MDWNSPLGADVNHREHETPNWYPPESIRKGIRRMATRCPGCVPPGPNNPLGDYKMRLAVGRWNLQIHGTNNPLAVGMAITHGCIRMYPEDVVYVSQCAGRDEGLADQRPVKVTYVSGDLLSGGSSACRR